MLIRATSLAVALAFAITSPVQAVAPTEVSGELPVTRPPTQSLQSLLTAGMQKTLLNDFEGGFSDYRNAIAHPDFAKLSLDDRYDTYLKTWAAAYNAKKYALSFDYLKAAQALKSEATDGQIWEWYMFTAFFGDMPSESVTGFTRMMAVEPVRIAQLLSPFLHDFLRFLEKAENGRELKYNAIRSIWDSGVMSSREYPPEYLWWELFEWETEHGESELAAEREKTFKSMDYILRVRVDNRYRAYAIADPERYDLKRAYDKKIEDQRKYVEDNPKRVGGITYLSYFLIDTGRAEEALDLMDAALANIDAYEDTETSLQWIYDIRAIALSYLGRHDEALLSQQEAWRIASANDNDRVSQTLNLANYYIRHDRPQEALDLLDGVKPEQSSEYGRMVAGSARVCALMALGRPEGVPAILASIKPYSKLRVGVYLDALICAADEDEAAALIIAELENPLTRNAMLRQAQNFKRPEHQTSYSARMWDAGAKIFAREDVMNTIRKYGVTEPYPVYGRMIF